MRVLIIGEGDGETAGSWSGITKSLVNALRMRGCDVVTADADVYGIDKWRLALETFSVDRDRWRTKFHFSRRAFEARTRRARAALTAHEGAFDCVIQIGATFSLGDLIEVPYGVYCDSNIRTAGREQGSGHSPASFFTQEELDGAAQREREVYSHASAILTISESLRQSFIEDFDCSDDKVHTVYPGPNLPRESGTMVDHHESEANLESVDEPIVLFVGARFERKGGPTLLRAFRRVRESIPRAELWLVGPADVEVRQPGVRNLGYLRKDEPTDYRRLIEAYRSARVFCLPTRYEPFGIVFLEAMHHGLPCVATRTGAIPEIVAHGETGLLCPVDDEEELASALIDLLTSPVDARRMGDAGRKRATELFTWERAADKTMGILRSLCSDPSPATAAEKVI